MSRMRVSRVLGGLSGLFLGFLVWQALLGAIRREVSADVLASSSALATALAIAATTIVLGLGLLLALLGAWLVRRLAGADAVRSD